MNRLRLFFFLLSSLIYGSATYCQEIPNALQINTVKNADRYIRYDSSTKSMFRLDSVSTTNRLHFDKWALKLDSSRMKSVDLDTLYKPDNTDLTRYILPISNDEFEGVLDKTLLHTDSILLDTLRSISTAYSSDHSFIGETPHAELDRINIGPEFPALDDKLINDALTVDGITRPMAAEMLDLKDVNPINGEISDIPKTSRIELDSSKIEEELKSRMIKETGLQGNLTENPSLSNLPGVKDIQTVPSLPTDVGLSPGFNPFKGRAAVLRSQMDKAVLLQRRYGDFADSRQLPKKVPNRMKGKSIRERIVLGGTFEVLPGTRTNIDIAPVVYYRFTGRISGGISGFRRVSYSNDVENFRFENSYGTRLFTTIDIAKGLGAYLEVERSKNQVRYSLPTVSSSTEWNTEANFGLISRQALNKRISLTSLVLYNLSQVDEFPNTVGASMRVGVEYKLKKRKQHP